MVVLGPGDGYFEPIRIPTCGMSVINQLESRTMTSRLAEYPTQCIGIPTPVLGQLSAIYLEIGVKSNTEGSIALGILELGVLGGL